MPGTKFETIIDTRRMENAKAQKPKPQTNKVREVHELLRVVLRMVKQFYA